MRRDAYGSPSIEVQDSRGAGLATRVGASALSGLLVHCGDCFRLAEINSRGGSTGWELRDPATPKAGPPPSLKHGGGWVFAFGSPGVGLGFRPYGFRPSS